MSALTVAAPTVGAAPAGLNPAQLAARERLVKAQDALADLEPLDPEYLAAEAAWERHRRWTGDDR